MRWNRVKVLNFGRVVWEQTVYRLYAGLDERKLRMPQAGDCTYKVGSVVVIIAVYFKQRFFKGRIYLEHNSGECR